MKYDLSIVMPNEVSPVYRVNVGRNGCLRVLKTDREHNTLTDAVGKGLFELVRLELEHFAQGGADSMRLAWLRESWAKMFAELAEAVDQGDVG